ncbi:DNA double-strand break repair nuclease NurA [Chloroflexota bacterium]
MRNRPGKPEKKGAGKMSLDLARVASQVGEMLSRLKDDLRGRQERLKYALETVRNQSEDIENLKNKITSSKTTWLVADLVDGLDPHYKALPLPSDFTVIATDGSHIDIDRHQAARCYLINIGSVVLDYGSSPGAVLDSVPSLYAGDEELVITEPGVRGNERVVEGALLGIKRGVDECRRLVELAEALPAGSSTLALLDGTLILWGLEAYPDFVGDILLEKGFLDCLKRLKELNGDKRLALASYISYPRSMDVVNALKVAVCPNNPLDTDKHCRECITRECDAVAGVRDRELFSDLLGQGERSALFITQSRIVKRYGEHRVYFFYIRLDDEVARVEIPQWVASDKDLLDLAHSLILDQCRRGQGYPVVLSEAHEQAVVTGADRENFWTLVEESLTDEKMQVSTSAKSRSKRMRWI